MTSRPRAWLPAALGRQHGVVTAALVLIAAAGCSVLASPAQGCAEMGVSVQRCQAIVEDAQRRLGDHPPVTGIAVEPVTQGDRDTLRSQRLLAIVRFSFVDGTARRVDVVCGGRNAATLVCTERPSAT